MKLYAIFYGKQGRYRLFEATNPEEATVEASKIFDLDEPEDIEVYEVTLNNVVGPPNLIKQ